MGKKKARCLTFTREKALKRIVEDDVDMAMNDWRKIEFVEMFMFGLPGKPYSQYTDLELAEEIYSREDMVDGSDSVKVGDAIYFKVKGEQS